MLLLRVASRFLQIRLACMLGAVRLVPWWLKLLGVLFFAFGAWLVIVPNFLSVYVRLDEFFKSLIASAGSNTRRLLPMFVALDAISLMFVAPLLGLHPRRALQSDSAMQMLYRFTRSQAIISDLLMLEMGISYMLWLVLVSPFLWAPVILRFPLELSLVRLLADLFLILVVWNLVTLIAACRLWLETRNTPQWIVVSLFLMYYSIQFGLIWFVKSYLFENEGIQARWRVIYLGLERSLSSPAILGFCAFTAAIVLLIFTRRICQRAVAQYLKVLSA